MLDASTNSTYTTTKWSWWFERNQLQNDSTYRMGGTTPPVCTKKSGQAICTVAQVLPISQLKFEGGWIYDNPHVQLYTIQPDPAFATKAFQMPPLETPPCFDIWNSTPTSSGQIAMGHQLKMCCSSDNSTLPRSSNHHYTGMSAPNLLVDWGRSWHTPKIGLESSPLNQLGNIWLI